MATKNRGETFHHQDTKNTKALCLYDRGRENLYSDLCD